MQSESIRNSFYICRARLVLRSDIIPRTAKAETKSISLFPKRNETKRETGGSGVSSIVSELGGLAGHVQPETFLSAKGI